MARKPFKRPAEFTAAQKLLIAAGWYERHSPEPMMESLGFDEFVYGKRGESKERKKTICHITVSDCSWEVKKYSREPFGDYTTIYELLGKGKSAAELEFFLTKTAES